MSATYAMLAHHAPAVGDVLPSSSSSSSSSLSQPTAFLDMGDVAIPKGALREVGIDVKHVTNLFDDWQESRRITLKEFLWNFDDFKCLSRPGIEASQNFVFISLSYVLLLTEKIRSFNFAKILIF